MKLDLLNQTAQQAASLRCDALVVLLAADWKPGRDAVSQLVAQARTQGQLEAKQGGALALYAHPAIRAPRALLLQCDVADARKTQQALLGALGTLRVAGVKSLVVQFAEQPSAQVLQTAVLALSEAAYVYTATKPSAKPSKWQGARIALPKAAALKAAFEQAKAMAAGIGFAKEWGNRPANHATPSDLALAAKTLAKSARMQCQVLGPAQVARLKMGAFIAVAQGSAEPLRFIELRYQGAAKTQAPVVLVGKGITFDSGGISIKPAPDMDEMKFDMCGAASVLGVFKALAELRPKLNVVGLIPACENLPSSRAVKPGDVVTTMSGQTVEILNTDAEGRLILCDALHYAKRFKPAAVIDIATLTGACVIALGHARAGLFCNDSKLAQALHNAGEQALDACWRMPLDDVYAEGLKSNFADVANVAGRPAGSVTAAKFLQRFVPDAPWAHLDIAGVAWKSGAHKGATGRPVALLLTYLLAQAAAAPSAKA